MVRIPPTVDMSDPMWNNNTGTDNDVLKIIFASSAFSRDKADLLVEEVDKLKRKYSLSIIGVDKTEYLRMFPNQMSIIDNNSDIRFYGRLSHIETIDHIKESDYLCFFRDVNRMTMCGFPTKFVEAKSCGIPVITNDTSDIALFMDDADVLIDSITDIDELVPVLENLNCAKSTSNNVFDYHHYIDEVNRVCSGICMV